MKSLHLKISVVASSLGLSAFAFSQLGTPPQGVTQPFAASPSSVAVSALNEGYFVANGASYYTRNGTTVKVEREISIKVTPTGIIGFDGQPLALGAGMMLTPDGRHAPIPAGINLQALPGTGNPFPAGPAEARSVQPQAPATSPVVTEIPEAPVPVRQR